MAVSLVRPPSFQDAEKRQQWFQLWLDSRLTVAATLGLLICTLISENQGLEKSRSVLNIIKSSGHASLDFLNLECSVLSLSQPETLQLQGFFSSDSSLSRVLFNPLCPINRYKLAHIYFHTAGHGSFKTTTRVLNFM